MMASRRRKAHGSRDRARASTGHFRGLLVSGFGSLRGEENFQKSYAEKLVLAFGLEVRDQGNKGHHVVDGQGQEQGG